jgi:hypothetical protein
MNAADSMVDVDYLRQRADSYELEALRLYNSVTQSRRDLGAEKHAKARELRAEAAAIEARIFFKKPLWSS